MPDVRELYQSVILDHNRAPRNYGPLADANGHARGHNPLCGDEVTVWVRVAGERIEEIRFVGSGCAISKASASLMTAAVTGRTIDEAETLAQRFHALVTGRAAGSPPDPTLGRLAVLGGVSQYPARVKCASLAWHAMHAALEEAATPLRSVPPPDFGAP